MLQIAPQRTFRSETMHFTIPTKKQIAASRKIMRETYGVQYLLSIDSDPKTIKSNESGLGIFTAIQYLAPAKMSGYQMCAFASKGCILGCLHSAGNPVYYKAKTKARIARTKFYIEARQDYLNVLYAEIQAFVAKCEKFDLKPAVRLNGTSDIVWERVTPWLFEAFPMVQFYDYTKGEKRMKSDWVLPANYDLTFSRSEDNEEAILRVLNENPKAKAAVVFNVKRTKPLPATWQGFEVGNADETDLRFLDTKRIAGLRAKGQARQDTSGFVVQIA